MVDGSTVCHNTEITSGSEESPLTKLPATEEVDGTNSPQFTTSPITTALHASLLDADTVTAPVADRSD